MEALIKRLLFGLLKSIFGLARETVNIVVTPGVAGTFIVRKPGGTAGTDEVQISISSLGDTLIDSKASGGSSGAVFVLGGVKSAGVRTPFTRTVMTLGVGGQYGWSNNSDVTQANPDTVMGRLAAGVIGLPNPDGLIPTGWFQITGGHKILNALQTSISDTLANTNLAWTLIAGRSYSIKIKLSGGDSTATEGIKIALTADGTLTATTFDLAVVGTNGTVVAGTTRVTSLGSVINYTTFTTTSDLWLVGEIKCGVAGVLTLQIATNAHAIGTLTLNAGSWGELNDVLAV